MQNLYPNIGCTKVGMCNCSEEMDFVKYMKYPAHVLRDLEHILKHYSWIICLILPYFAKHANAEIKLYFQRFPRFNVLLRLTLAILYNILKTYLEAFSKRLSGGHC